MSSQARRSIRKDSLRIEALVVPPLSNNVYIVYQDGENSAILIDAGLGADVITKRLSELELNLKLIVNTHGHTDHTADDGTLRKMTGANIAIHELDAYRLAVDDEASEELGIEKLPIEPDIQLIEGENVTVGADTKLRVLHTPGHTEGSICLYDSKRNLIFSGDTLFARGYGRTDGAGASPSAMVSSLQRLMNLPKDTVVYPGHGAFTSIGDETWLVEMLEKTPEKGS